MTEAARILQHTFRRVALMQGGLMAVAAGVAAWFARDDRWAHAGASALYGGAISLLVAWRLAHSLNAAATGGSGSAQLYLGAAERFVLVAVLLALGFAVLKLAPLAVIGGFALAQLGFLGGAGAAGRRGGS
ncbi:MAG: ATP synthase subunit I [Acidiferrobacteraceae bacterium]